ncbi:MAG TPA: hypothetical protein VK975_01585, partial [Acidimicrobiales bacterium]|nr:hypothetical protein [Acidimicrobiales bacterium]
DAGVHRGWKGDPLYDIRKLLLLGAKRVNDTGWARLRAAFAAGDPTDVLSGTWSGKEKVRDVYSPTTSPRPPAASTTPSPGNRHRGRARAADPGQDAATVAGTDPRPPHHRRLQRPRSRQRT